MTEVDWARVAEIVFDAAVTGCLAAAFTVGLGAVVAYAVDRFYRRRRFQEQEDVLLQLAELRLRGVKLRNRGLGATLDDIQFEAWNAEMEAWREDLYKTADTFSPVEGERLRTLDDMPAQVFPVQNPKQVHVLRYVSETLRRLDRMLEQRFRPTMAP